MKSIRVLLVWGSETNNTQGFVTKIEKEWREKHGDSLKVLDVVQGDDAADKRWEEISSKNYDYLLVATSSYGEGEPPSGFGRFVYRLQEASKADSKPLQGLQHAVLGIGSSAYETFQNIPRHVDMYLGECGSRRCLQRFEWDEMEHTDEEIITGWSDNIVKIMTAGNCSEEASKPDVCSWKEPESLILKRVIDEDGYEVGQGPTGFGLQQMFVVGVGLAAAVAYWYNKQSAAAMPTEE